MVRVGVFPLSCRALLVVFLAGWGCEVVGEGLIFMLFTLISIINFSRID